MFKWGNNTRVCTETWCLVEMFPQPSGCISPHTIYKKKDPAILKVFLYCYNKTELSCREIRYQFGNTAQTQHLTALMSNKVQILLFKPNHLFIKKLGRQTTCFTLQRKEKLLLPYTSWAHCSSVAALYQRKSLPWWYESVAVIQNRPTQRRQAGCKKRPSLLTEMFRKIRDKMKIKHRLTDLSAIISFAE